MVVPKGENGMVIGGETFNRIAIGKPSPVPKNFADLPAKAVPITIRFTIFERGGKLWTLTE